MTSPYKNRILHTTVTIHPHQMENKLYLNLKQNLVKKVEGKCFGSYGYVMDVIEILDKEDGEVPAENFDASAIYGVTFSCRLCAPVKNIQIICQIEMITRAIMRLKNGPITVVVMSDRINNSIFTYDIYGNLRYKEDKNYKNLAKNDFVKVTIVSLMFNDGDDKIIALGYLNNIADKKDIETFYKDLYRKDLDIDPTQE